MVPYALLKYAEALVDKDVITIPDVRASIIHSYYAVMLYARDKWNITKFDSVHSDVYTKMKSIFPNEARDLHTGKKLREKASYKITESADSEVYDQLDAHLASMRDIFLTIADEDEDQLEEMAKPLS